MDETVGRDRVCERRLEVAIDISHPEQEGRRAARLERLLEGSLDDLVELGVVAVEHLAVANDRLHFRRRELPSHAARLAKRNNAVALSLGRADGGYLFVELCRERIRVAIVTLQASEDLFQVAPYWRADRRDSFRTRGRYDGHRQCNRDRRKKSSSHFLSIDEIERRWLHDVARSLVGAAQSDFAWFRAVGGHHDIFALHLLDHPRRPVVTDSEPSLDHRDRRLIRFHNDPHRLIV